MTLTNNRVLPQTTLQSQTSQSQLSQYQQNKYNILLPNVPPSITTMSTTTSSSSNSNNRMLPKVRTKRKMPDLKGGIVVSSGITELNNSILYSSQIQNEQQQSYSRNSMYNEDYNYAYEVS